MMSRPFFLLRVGHFPKMTVKDKSVSLVLVIDHGHTKRRKDVKEDSYG